MKHLKNFKIFESVFETPFYIFGSEDSQDYDVLVSVDHIPQNIDEAHNICKYYNDKLSSTLLPDKELNCNLGVFEDGRLVKVFKGTVDELNNVIYYTYDNHKQFYPNPITEPINRDVDEKILRVARFIITFYSRTELRSQIKAALRGDLKLKLQVLKQINFVDMVDFPGKKEKFEDIYKVLAFQFGQVFSLVDGFESDSYTKNGILKNYPDLKNFLKRNPLNTSDLETLNKYLSRFIDLIESKIDTIKLVEN
jgi:F0F1-type ATP synthase delta subunit